MNRSTKIIIAVFAVVLLVVLVLGYFVPDMLTETVPENQPTASVSQQVQPSAAAVPTRTPKEEKPSETVSSTESANVDEPSEEAPVETSALRFRNEKLLNQHYEKHGIDMGFASAEEYEKAAAAVPENPNVLHKTEKEDGDDVYYVEATNEFVIVSTDGYIRTYFKPDSGIKYFNKQ